jgi:mycothiol synthase
MVEARRIAERAQAPERPPLPSAAHGLLWVPGADVTTACLADLVRRVEAADAVPFRTSDEELREHLEAPWRDPSRDALVGLDADRVPRAFASVDLSPGAARCIIWAGVDPAWRRRGVGREVLAWALGRARQQLAASDATGPARIVEFVEDSATSTVALVRAAGFVPVRYDATMRRPLDGDLPDVVVPAGLRLETWTPGRDEEARLAHNEAFADHTGSEPRSPEQWQSGRSTFVPEWSAVVIDEASDRVVGYQLSDRYEQDWAVTGHSFGYTGLLGVRRAWRGRGVARALLADAMRRYRADGMEVAELSVDTDSPTGAFRLYESLGYVRASSATMWAIDL